MTSSDIKVLITGAAGQIGYALLPQLGYGKAFGEQTKLHIVMLDIPNTKEVMRGVAMEIEDCSFPLINKITYTEDKAEAFDGIDVAILIGSSPRKPGQLRSDLIKINSKIFAEQGEFLEKYAKKSVKILVVGNPANTNCLICSLNAPSIPRKNFTCLTMLDQNRMTNQISKKLNIPVDHIRKAAIFGNHSPTMVPLVSMVQIGHSNQKQAALSELISDENWMNEDLLTTVRLRGREVMEARKLSSAFSASKAICDHLRNWFLGTRDGDWCSMGVISDGSSYSIAKDIVFSFPVICQKGEYEIVTQVPLSDSQMELLKASERELLQEKSDALAHLIKSDEK